MVRQALSSCAPNNIHMQIHIHYTYIAIYMPNAHIYAHDWKIKLSMYLLFYMALVLSTFWAQMALVTLVAISGPKKVSIFRALPKMPLVMDMPPSKKSRFLGPPPPPKMPLVMDMLPSKPLCTAPYKQQVHY